jgi:Family of unknown function (DUF6338)
MPTGVGGLLYFVAFLTPGLAFLLALEHWRPGREYSVLRESAVVVIASAVFGGVSLAALGLLRSRWPDVTPDIGRLIRGERTFVEAHYVSLGLWFAATLIFAATLAGGAGYLWGKQAAGGQGPNERRSGWGKAYDCRSAEFVRVGIELTDDSYAEGWLVSMSSTPEEGDDRSLVLAPPVFLRRPNGRIEEWPVGSLVVGAGQIRFVAFRYFDARTPGEWPELPIPSNQ